MFTQRFLTLWPGMLPSWRSVHCSSGEGSKYLTVLHTYLSTQSYTYIKYLPDSDLEEMKVPLLQVAYGYIQK